MPERQSMAGRSVYASRTAKLLFTGVVGLWLAASSGRAESYYGMPVVKTVNGNKIVDVRPMLSKLNFVNARGRTAFSYVRASTPLCDVTIAGWKPNILTAQQLAYAREVSGDPTKNIPAGSELFLFTPKTKSTMYVIGGLYYANGVWNAVQLGASRESRCDHAWRHTGTYDSAGHFYLNWCPAWPQAYPTVVVMMDYYGTVMTYGVVLNGDTTAPPGTPPSYPAAPANTYTLVQKDLSWSQAKLDAESRGGYLATITSPAEWTNILKQVGSSMLNHDVWLGASDAAKEGDWRWVTGEPWSYNRWTPGQPNNHGSQQHYLELWSPTGSAYTWDDQNNIALSFYLMESNGLAYPPAPTNHLYQLIQGRLTWSQAKADAESRGGHLASITDPVEWSNVVAQVGAANLRDKDIWLGATDEIAEGDWQWITGEPWLYTRWGAGQPNNAGGHQHYLHLWSSSGASLQWDDMEQEGLAGYLLETVAEPVAPSPAIITRVADLPAPEGGTATCGVKLSAVPASATTVSVFRASGDGDIRVVGGGTLVFTPANYGTYQDVTLAADEDADTANGSATIQVTAPGYTAALVTATEQDNDTPAFSARINSGGPAMAGAWTADTGFEGGRVWRTAAAVVNATDGPMALYQRERSAGAFRYNLPAVPDGTYRVKLHFSEMSATSAGQRIFDVAIEGVRVITNLDVFAAAGGPRTALVQTFDVAVSDGNGLQLDFTGVKNTAEINAIEIESAEAPVVPVTLTSTAQIPVPEGGGAAFGVKLSVAPATATTVSVVRASGDGDIRIVGGGTLVFTPANYGTYQNVALAADEDADTVNGAATIRCAGPGVTSALVVADEQDNDTPAFSARINSGGPAMAGAWTADTGFEGGRVWRTAAAVVNATDGPMALYQRERSAGAFRYNLPAVPDGTYRVKLHFSEMSATSAGQRIFDVAIEGVRVITNLDVFAAAGGPRTALVQTFDVAVSDGNGLQLDFTGVKNTAEINAIEIESAVTPDPEPGPEPLPGPQVNSYLLISSDLTWTQAKEDAEKRGGYLATITSEDEWRELLKQVGTDDLTGKDVWLGASDAAQEGAWQWVTGESWAYSRWGANQPNNIGNRQHYLHLWSVSGTRLRWDDMEDAPLPHYLLEIPAAADPAARQPYEILASPGEPPNDDPWTLVDLDSHTWWMGRYGAGGWWVVLAYPEPVQAGTLRIDWLDDVYTADLTVLWSLDAQTWTPLDFPAREDPPWLRYLWLIFADDGSGEPPAIDSIRWE